MNYEYYKAARDKAWKVLIECGVNHLPLDLMNVIKFYGIKIMPYFQSDYVKTLGLDIQNGDGFSTEENRQKIIYFNDQKDNSARRRFTIAHELGHCLLGHDLSKIKFRNSEIDSPNDSIEEMQTNVFARDILMPAIVLHHTGCIKYTDIMRLCKVSKESAQIREERMKILEERNKFCLSPLEQQVYNNFRNYIEIIKSINKET